MMLITPEEYRRYSSRERDRKLRPMSRTFFGDNVSVFIGRYEHFDGALHFLVQTWRYDDLHYLDSRGHTEKPALSPKLSDFEEAKVFYLSDWFSFYVNLPRHAKDVLIKEGVGEYLEGMTLSFYPNQEWDILFRTQDHWVRLEYFNTN